MGSEDAAATNHPALSLSGELDVVSAASVRDKINAVDAAVIVVDTAGLTFVDSTGLAGLLDAQADLERQGRRLKIVNCPPTLTRLLQVTALTGRFDEA